MCKRWDPDSGGAPAPFRVGSIIHHRRFNAISEPDRFGTGPGARLRPPDAPLVQSSIRGDTCTKFRSGNCPSTALGARARLAACPDADPNASERPRLFCGCLDLEQSKSAVLNSLPSQSSQRSYDHAIREFIEWYCSEPPVFNSLTLKTVLAIRTKEADAFELYRAALKRISVEHVQSGKRITPAEARQIYSDILRPQLLSQPRAQVKERAGRITLIADDEKRFPSKSFRVPK